MNPIVNGVFNRNKFTNVVRQQGSEIQLTGFGAVVEGDYTPNNILLPSTNTNQGYFQGQMLATATGDGTGAFAGLTNGCNVNLDPNSTDTGQQIWNGRVIVSIPGLTQPMSVGSAVNSTMIYCSIPNSNWQLISEYLYMGGLQFSAAEILAVKTYLKSLQASSNLNIEINTLGSSGSSNVNILVY